MAREVRAMTVEPPNPTLHHHGNFEHDHPGGDVTPFAAIAGGLVWAGTDSDANACRNALIGALAP